MLCTRYSLLAPHAPTAGAAQSLPPTSWEPSLQLERNGDAGGTAWPVDLLSDPLQQASGTGNTGHCRHKCRSDCGVVTDGQRRCEQVSGLQRTGRLRGSGRPRAQPHVHRSAHLIPHFLPQCLPPAAPDARRVDTSLRGRCPGAQSVEEGEDQMGRQGTARPMSKPPGQWCEARRQRRPGLHRVYAPRCPPLTEAAAFWQRVRTTRVPPASTCFGLPRRARGSRDRPPLPA